jgi:hypothetical protein
MGNKGTHNDVGNNIHWGSPAKVVDTVRDFFGGTIDLDPCSNDTNSIVRADVEYKLPYNDGLVDPWDVRGQETRVYVNPPFGRCFLRDDRQVVLSQKEWTAGRKAWKALVEASGPPEEGAVLVDTTLPGYISDEYAQRFKSTTIKDWIAKAVGAYKEKGCEVVMLMPASVDTAAWQKLVFQSAAAKCYIAGRLHFLGDVSGPAPMACALVYWGAEWARFAEFFSSLGHVE